MLKQRMERAKRRTEEQLKQVVQRPGLGKGGHIRIASDDDDSVQEKLDYVTESAPCGHLRIPRGASGGAGGPENGGCRWW